MVEEGHPSRKLQVVFTKGTEVTMDVVHSLKERLIPVIRQCCTQKKSWQDYLQKAEVLLQEARGDSEDQRRMRSNLLEAEVPGTCHLGISWGCVLGFLSLEFSSNLIGGVKLFAPRSLGVPWRRFSPSQNCQVARWQRKSRRVWRSLPVQLAWKRLQIKAALQAFGVQSRTLQTENVIQGLGVCYNWRRKAGQTGSKRRCPL